MPKIARDLFTQIRVFLPISRECLLPSLPSCAAPSTEALGKTSVDSLGNEKLGILRPAIELLREPNLGFAKRIAVRSGRVLLMGRAITNNAVPDDQGGAVLRALKSLQRSTGLIEIVGVLNPKNVPAIATEAHSYVLAEGEIRMAFNGHCIVVVDPT